MEFETTGDSIRPESQTHRINIRLAGRGGKPRTMGRWNGLSSYGARREATNDGPLERAELVGAKQV